jgi:hypothetical protein
MVNVAPIGSLSWHPFTSSQDESLEVKETGPTIDFLGRSTDLERPSLQPGVFVELVCEALDVEMTHVCSRRRDRPTATVRRLIAALGVERWRQNRTALARVLQKNPDVVSWWAGEGAQRRIDDPQFAAELDRVDKDVARKAAELTRAERMGTTS